MFDPNPHAIKEQIDKLLSKQPGGWKMSVEDAKLLVNQRKWAEEEGSNGWIFWNAVYTELEALRQKGLNQ